MEPGVYTTSATWGGDNGPSITKPIVSGLIKFTPFTVSPEPPTVTVNPEGEGGRLDRLLLKCNNTNEPSQFISAFTQIGGGTTVGVGVTVVVMLVELPEYTFVSRITCLIEAVA